ncbi:hypothetical protein CEK26_003585 [Fusarium fujikuroi]|nr:hypothetical protein CEK27_003577 [Fusarium fujikuroi]QGI88582.1 hypothetical protein CEK25_003538 [Fusarium fujikuroi]QGJ02141.1 hypothetical protein CEK26_003585 [Fusarium fujikuroi]
MGEFRYLIILPLIREQEETAEMDSWLEVQKQNRTLQILRSAAEGRYGVLAIIWWTKLLTRICHDHGIAVEAESGRINGGEEGIADTGSLEAMFTTPREVEDFLAAGIDLLAPSIGNIHGDYGPAGPQLDFDRLSSVNTQVNSRVIMALHGTNDFTPEIMQRCIQSGAVKLNINKLILESWNTYVREHAQEPLMQLMDGGMAVLQAEVERWMVICGSSGKTQ